MNGNIDVEIRVKKQTERQQFSAALKEMGAAVNNGVGRDASADAIRTVLRHFGKEPDRIVTTEASTFEEQLDASLQPAGIVRRDVKLRGKWYRDATGPLMGFTSDGAPVALLPTGFLGYRFFDRSAGRYRRVTKASAGKIKENAFSFYRPLPAGKLTARELIVYAASCIHGWDYVSVIMLAALVSILSMLMPKLNSYLFSNVIPSGDSGLLAAVACMLVSVTVASLLLGLARSFSTSRLQTRIAAPMQAAVYLRVLRMPTTFFRDFSSGELSNRVSLLSGVATSLLEAFFSTGLTAIFSIIYVFQMLKYAPALVLPAMAVVIVSVLLYTLAVFGQIKVNRRKMRIASETAGLTYELFSGIQKIRLTGAERRAFGKWADQYSREAQETYAPPRFLVISGALITASTMLGTIAIYLISVLQEITVADFYAFNTCYSMVTTALTGLASSILTVAAVRPALDMAKPILSTEPETGTGKYPVAKLEGEIELSHISFRYSEHQPQVLNDLSLHIMPGEYVAVVGKTGCGKSTLMRLLMGFETPDTGAVYYDKRDLADLDKQTLRRRIGVVLQDGRLFPGDIYSNIVLSMDKPSMGAALRAAEVAGIRADIEKLPMGMQTHISEGSGGISGGQKQRILIARAIASNPAVLLMDEATSALDNITQKAVSDALQNLNCTRVVIAHRLSTIKNCDRILFIENGKIAEDGTYQELIKRNGAFAALVSRQQMGEPA